MAALSVEAGGLAVRLECDREDVLARLARRYRGFESQQSQALNLQAEVVPGGRAGSCLQAELLFSQDGLSLRAAEYNGEIHLGSGQGKLRLGERGAEEGLEYFMRAAYALLAFEAGGLLFHGAGIVRGGRAFIFFGASGCGKTTVARLSLQEAILNDDLLLLMPEENRWRVYATPFWNPTQARPRAASAPLAGLFRLEQDKQVYLAALSRGQALAELVASAPVISADAGRSAALMQRAAGLLAGVPVYRLHFLPDTSFWSLVVEACAGIGRPGL
ncbi:MAG: hypothetical protein L0Z70_14160 [Chloroflexi bacterium]|nr:hypothetical protein [Chloroflexota bacterium]